MSASDVVSGASRSFSSSNSSRTGLYCVEFLRGQIDIFHFKRLYDGVRRQLSALVRVVKLSSFATSTSCMSTVHDMCIGMVLCEYIAYRCECRLYSKYYRCCRC